MLMRLYLFGSPYFNVEVTTETEGDNIAEIADIVAQVFSGVYDSMGLLTGHPQQVRVDGYSLVGTRTFAQFSFSLPNFEADMRNAGLVINDWMALSVGNPELMGALRDIRFAMMWPGEVAVHCYRAIERIRQRFSTGGGNKARLWEALALALDVQRSWLDIFNAHATALRHGELVSLEVDERNRCLTQAATVLIRYAAYVKGGRVPLTAPAFPLLN